VNTVIRVSENEDLDRVFAAINSVGDDLTRDPEWSSSILAAPRALGIEGFTDSGIDIRIQGETQPNRQWDVTRELRLRLKKAFDAEGIKRSA
jgi:small-conductance mechanosensitive channel